MANRKQHATKKKKTPTCKVQSVMSTAVACCRTTASAAEAARLMWTNDCGIIPVVDAEGRLKGVITDRDICIAALMAGKTLAAMPVGEVMSHDIATVQADADLAEVHARMRERRVRRIPVVDAEERPVGIVSLNDLSLAAAGARGPEGRAQQQEVASTLARVSAHWVPASATEGALGAATPARA